MKVPFMELKSEHRVLREELRTVWEDALDNAAFIGGTSVEKFETAFAEFCEVKHAIGVGNGTDALILALKALGIGSGDEVITAANTFVATAEAIVHSGAAPVFVDMDPFTYTMDVRQIEQRITPRTKAIIPVHLYGQPADMGSVLSIARKYGLNVVEDSAQAHGARLNGQRAGSMGDAACFSFYPAKNIGACGDGGAVVTSDPQIADRVRKLRDHGGLRKYEHQLVGFNSRLDSVQASVLTTKLRHLERRNQMRRQHARQYKALLAPVAGVITPSEPTNTVSVYHLYVIRLEKGDRNKLKQYLEERGIQTGIHYPAPVPCTPAFADFHKSACPEAEKCAGRILSLPMYPELTTQQIEFVADNIGAYMRALKNGNDRSVPRAKEASTVWSI